jgi:hypothetical protein
MKLFRKKPGDTFLIDKLTVAEAKQEAKEKAWREEKRKKGTPEGFWLRYTGPEQAVGLRIHLVPLLSQPIFVHHPAVVGKDECPTCNVIHPVKTHHLWLNSDGKVLVSRGIYESIQGEAGGLAVNDLTLDGGTNTPPPLAVGAGKSRRETDQENEAIIQYVGGP